MGDDWNPDYSYVASEADAPGEEQLDRLVTFSQDHTKKLAEIESAIHETVGQPWSTVSDPIVMHMQPEERVFVPDLIVTENELFKKVVTVMAVLCDEAHQLKADAVAHFYPALAVFGRTAVADDGHEKAVPDEERVMHMGRMLKFFQELQNFVDRCNSIVVNAVHQFASLYHRRQRIWETTYKNVHLMSVFRALASILEVLITLDAIVADNHALKMAWDKFKRMMQFARADPAAYGTDEGQLRRFDALLVRLNESVEAPSVGQERRARAGRQVAGSLGAVNAMLGGRSFEDFAAESAARRRVMPKQEVDGESCRVFLGNLPFKADETALQEHFERSGKIEGVHWVTDKETGKFYGSAFATFESPAAAQRAASG
jgi:hypothetical protein